MRAAKLGLVIVTITALAALVRNLGAESGTGGAVAKSTLALGFLLLFAFALGQVAYMARAPKITGFLLAGIIAGPFGLGIVTNEDSAPLQLVNGLALSLIAFTAGGELKISRFKPRIYALGQVVLFQTAYTFAAVFVVMFSWLYFTELLGQSAMVAFCGAALLGIISTANSPATAIAVITETKSRGPVSDVILGATVIKDVTVVAIFGVAASVTATIMGAGEGIGGHLATDMVTEIGLSVALGLFAGAVMIAYLNTTEENVALFIVGAALVVVELCYAIGADILLVSITAGFIVENYSSGGEKLIRGIETSSATIYVIFFSLAGQGLDIDALATLWPLAAALVIVRAAGVRYGTMAGLSKAGEPKEIGKNAWAGFIGQAGVSIGFAVLISSQFPSWGPKLAALIMAGIVINQIVGPVLMKRSLVRAGEAGRTSPGKPYTKPEGQSSPDGL